MQPLHSQIEKLSATFKKSLDFSKKAPGFSKKSTGFYERGTCFFAPGFFGWCFFGRQSQQKKKRTSFGKKTKRSGAKKKAEGKLRSKNLCFAKQKNFVFFAKGIQSSLPPPLPPWQTLHNVLSLVLAYKTKYS